MSRSIPTTVLIALAGLIIFVAFLSFNWVNTMVRSVQRNDGSIIYVVLGVLLIVALTVPLLGIWATLTRRRWAPIVVSAVGLWMLSTAFSPAITVLNVVIAFVGVGATVAAWLPATRAWLASRTRRDGEGK